MEDQNEAWNCLEWREPFAEFARELRIRLAADTHTTEDTIRYYFWNALVKSGADAHTLVPEMPHPNPAMKGKEVDLRLDAKPFGPAWLEVKYNRGLPSKRNLPRTQVYGALLTDFFKLALIEDGDPKLVLYVSTPEMVRHLKNNAGGLLESTDRPFVLSPEDFDDLPASARNTVLKKVVFEDAPPQIAATVLAQESIADHEAFLFEVRHDSTHKAGSSDERKGR
ncbi:MAG: hypothetical protein IH987_02030 [Planctomycetes bacterium]|nr:hypothetical protein [Planctomycetota bacterium]